MAVMKIPVVKAGGATIDVDTSNIPENVYAYIVELGLKTLINRGTTKITKASVPDTAKREAEAMAVAQKQLQAINEGKVRIVGSKTAQAGKITGEVNTEAMRLARNMVKDAMKAKKIKVSYVEASEITKAARALLAAKPEIIEQAKASLEARKAKSDEAGDILAGIVGAVPQSQKKIDAEAKRKSKEDKPLSAKQVTKPKARPQPQATA